MQSSYWSFVEEQDKLVNLLVGIVMLSGGGGGVISPPGPYAPNAWNPDTMSANLDQYPVEVKAGDIFHVHGHATDRDQWMDLSGHLVMLDSTVHELKQVEIESGTLVGGMGMCTGTEQGGVRNYDFTIEAISDLNGASYLLKHDSYIGHDNYYQDAMPHDRLKDPDVPGGGNTLGYIVKISLSGPTP